jgi:hypothetical protein
VSRQGSPGLTAPSPSTVTEAQTLAPDSAPTRTQPGEASASVHDPRDHEGSRGGDDPTEGAPAVSRRASSDHHGQRPAVRGQGLQGFYPDLRDDPRQDVPLLSPEQGVCCLIARWVILRRPGRRIGQRGDATRAPTQGPRPERAARCRPVFPCRDWCESGKSTSLNRTLGTLYLPTPKTPFPAEPFP